MTISKNEIPAGTFKAKCLQIMEDVRSRRVEVVITKRGVPVAKLVPIESTPPDVFDCMKGSATLVGDVVGPVVPSEDWEASR
jgi:prevent-host-death family protein